MALFRCCECGRIVSDKASVCPHCGCPIENVNIKCPKCGSDNIDVVDNGYSLLWGLLGAKTKRNHCTRCGYRWKP